MNANELQKHMLATYRSLRFGVAAIAFAFPLILWIGGRLNGIPLQDSMSAYYHAELNGNSMRNWFVGILFAVGIIVYVYKGYSHKENYALNLAGVLAIGIAIFPMEWDCGETCKKLSLHGISAVSFFLCIAYVCVFRGLDTLHLLKDEAKEKKYRIVYRFCGAGMVLSPIVAYFFTIVFQRFESYTFYIELAGILAFASFWAAKSREISETKSESLVLCEMIDM